ncbi:hypothetical protein PILCRDRAFT_170722 [Piloderma croceum F 1598]|uniref:Uncharacterized protein n=1 Tax=Piloderma croceum (strain F 1598) TaxID=765440 RepID=A0A0C3G4S8_PILCF|nr:hypothetical protein PILCRDRAFT_170722 [Piloderma croceum F 1598]
MHASDLVEMGSWRYCIQQLQTSTRRALQKMTPFIGIRGGHSSCGSRSSLVLIALMHPWLSESLHDIRAARECYSVSVIRSFKLRNPGISDFVQRPLSDLDVLGLVYYALRVTCYEHVVV